VGKQQIEYLWIGSCKFLGEHKPRVLCIPLALVAFEPFALEEPSLELMVVGLVVVVVCTMVVVEEWVQLCDLLVGVVGGLGALEPLSYTVASFVEAGFEGKLLGEPSSGGGLGFSFEA
jgi:hypothetical protein